MPTTEVKILSSSGAGFRVGGYGVVWGGRDVVGDYFSKGVTDFWFDRISHTPMVLYQHGQDGSMKRTVVGQVVSKTEDDIGLWIEAQITASKKYADAIRDLVKKGILGWSSGSVPHLVNRVKGALPGTNEITSWPIVELSLTPTPAEPRTIGVRELKSLAALDSTLSPLLESIKQVEGSYEDLREDICEAAGDLLGGYCNVVATFPDYAIVTTNGEDYFRIPYTLDSDGDPQLGTPEPVSMSFTPMSGSSEKATLNAESRNRISASNFAYIDSEGGRHLPIHDEAHVRNAMARFSQTHFESPEKKKTAARKILAKARSMGIEVADDSAIANAAKGVSLNDLPDDAFAYVEPGTLDDERKTFPRANRHFPHHDENGEVDSAQLELSIAEAKHAGDLGEHALAHLLAHREGHDAHTKFWAEDSAAGQLLVIANEILELTDLIVTDQKSMERLGYGKSALRIRPEPLQRLEELKAWFEAVIAHADSAESGDDGTARADYLRRRLALLDV